ncbi:hypothetical protein JV173_03280 [Acholeplasma equirhinis]|nr:hypothetical protein [Acholeplasma equirhinis]MBN3490531.1 hypothetical protein [Acholeplasma equirhinis]
MSLTAPITDRVRDFKRSIKYAFEPDGFVIFVILTVLGLIVSGLLLALF